MRLVLAILALLAAPAQVTTSVQPKPANEATSSGLGFSKHDSNQPINVSADSFDANLQSKVGTYHGNVVVVQGDMKMRADSVQIVEVQDKPNKVYAHGNVVVNAPNGIGTGDDGVYDLVVKTITLTGKKVVLSKEKNVMVGTKLVMDQNTNLAHLTSAGLAGGRVQAVFQPQHNDQSNGGAKKPAPNGGK
ncbi:MAG TPA: lipopolysaccharide transport periplasmic protein LptA [Rhizomicrobium sp.]|jgi:lipopolysaccharide export system protein LptA